MNQEVSLEDFRRYFPHTPTALCIKECARLTALRREKVSGPLLDVGCGDGLFAGLAYEGLEETWGIDIDEHELRLARKAKAYSKIIEGDITTFELPSSYFNSCVANCSLEHVPRIDLALTNILQSLKAGGTFITFVPNARWAEHLRSYQALAGLGAQPLADLLKGGIDSFFKHHHLYDEDGWKKLVVDAGFEVLAVDPVLSSATTTAFELFLLPSLLGWANKKATKRWTNVPALRKALAAPVYWATRAALSAGDQTPTAEFMVVARRPLPASGHSSSRER